MTFRFDHPHLLWLALLVVPVVWLGVRNLGLLDPARRWTAIGLRVVVLLVVVAMLAGLQTVRWHTDLTVITVVDQSESIRRLAPGIPAPDNPGHDPSDPAVSDADWIMNWIERSADDHEPGDRLGLVTYDARPTVHTLPSPAFDLDPDTLEDPAPGTDTAAALRLAMALFPPDTGKRLVLVSDGNDTAGRASGEALTTTSGGQDLLTLAREARAAGIPIDVLPVEYQLRDEVIVESVHAPTVARQGQTAALRVVLRAARPTAGLLQVKHDAQLIDLNGPATGTGLPVTTRDWTMETSDAPAGAGGTTPTADPADAASSLGRYLHMRKIDLPLVFAGPNHFEAVFEPAEGSIGGAGGAAAGSAGDTISANNHAQAFTLVHGKGRVLFVTPPGGGRGGDAASTKILPSALQAHGIDMDVVPPRAVPTRLSKLQRYDAVVLQDVPSESVSVGQQQLLARYVSDLGGGLVMVGGPDSFGPGGWANSPVDRVLPVDCEISNTTLLPSGALILVLDRSGSMASGVSGSHMTQQDIANESAVLALSTLYPQDMVGVIAFDSSAKWIAKLQMNNNPNRIARLIRKIQPGGGTDIYPGLETAYEALAPLTTQDAAIKHVVLLTDGQSQSGQYYKIVGKMVRAGITLTTIAVGDGANGQLLAQLAQMGGGTFHPVTDPRTLPQVFIKEARTIRRNLIKEGDFTPALVRTGSPIADGLGGVPNLKGFVRTQAKPDPRVYIPMLGPEGEPIFAHWQIGLGRSAAFTSDATNRWATDWLTWPGYPDFWARTVRAIARPQPTQNADLVTTVAGDTLHVRLDTATAARPTGRRRRGPNRPDSFANFMTVVGTVLNPDGTSTPITLKQTAPGVYEATAPAAKPGNYLVSLFSKPGDGPKRQRDAGVTAIFGGATKHATPELRHLTSNRRRLEQVAQITGGRVLEPGSAAASGLFERSSITPSRSIRPLWQPLLLWLLVIFWFDVATRRIAWDVAATRKWFAAKTLTLTQLLKGRDSDAAATLDALKRRAAKVDERLGTTAAEPQPADRPASDTKFEAGAGAPAEDFTTALGGASDAPPAPKITPTTTVDESPGDDADTTSRLLGAKRRARNRAGNDESALPEQQNPPS